jgi:hypothetical protein
MIASAYFGREPSSKIKQTRILHYFCSGNSLHRFSAEKLGDHTLPTTISCLQKKHSLQFLRHWVSVPNRFGGETKVKSYWLEGTELERAQDIASAELGIPTTETRTQSG